MITIHFAKKVFRVGPLLIVQKCILAWVGVSCGIFVDYAIFCVFYSGFPVCNLSFLWVD